MHWNGRPGTNSEAWIQSLSGGRGVFGVTGSSSPFISFFKDTIPVDGLSITFTGGGASLIPFCAEGEEPFFGLTWSYLQKYFSRSYQNFTYSAFSVVYGSFMHLIPFTMHNFLDVLRLLARHIFAKRSADAMFSRKFWTYLTGKPVLWNTFIHAPIGIVPGRKQGNSKGYPPTCFNVKPSRCLSLLEALH